MYVNMPKAIWTDIRSSISDYSAEELLVYYRSAKSLCFSKEVQDREGVSIEIARKVYQRVDSIILTMRCSSDHRIATMSKVLETEYCKEPVDLSAKIDNIGISKSSYYNYCREAKKLFTEMVDALNN